MQNSNTKLIALDVDGTIMDKDCRISQRVKKAVNQAIEKGVYVLIATGRMYNATVPIALELGLKTPLILCQGSIIREFQNSDKILLNYNVDTDLSCKVIQDLRAENVQINVYIDDKLYIENESPILKDYISRRDIPFYRLNSFEDIDNLLPTKIMGLDPDPLKINKINKKLNEKYSGKLNITKSTDYFCEFVNKKCSKADAVLFLAEKWGINQAEIMAIGDHDNDKEMIEIAGLGVAMGNSHKELKETADYVTDTIDNDGAALAIEKFVL